VVIENPVPPADLDVGDVVSLRTGSRLQSIFTHRVTRTVPREGTIWVETKGDANAAPDPSLTSSDHVIGRVSVVIPYAGFLLALLSVPSGVLFAVLLAGVLLTLTWLLESLEIELAIREAGRRVDEATIARRASPATRPRRARRASDPLAGGR
jgi:signal peptidase